MRSLPKHLVLGAVTEKKGEEYLLRSGNRQILVRNFRLKVGEIDLVLEERLPSGELELVFVEVRARTSGKSWVDGISSVDARKRLRLKRAISAFLRCYRGNARSARLDLLAWDGAEWTHLKNVW